MSNGNQARNLDILCAETGRALAGIEKMEERILNAALAVLEEQGPYAMLLYLKARHGETFGKAEEVFKTLLKGAFQNNKENDQSDVLTMVKDLAQNLDDLLFARDLMRNTLAYARYHYKAKQSKEGAS